VINLRFGEDLNSPLKPMLSATRKLAMTHRSIPRWISVVSLFGERGLLGHARHVEQPRRDDKSATPCEHGSIGKTKADDAPPWVHREISADVVCGSELPLGTGGWQNPAPPPLSWRR